MQFDTLPGFRAFYPDACGQRNFVFGRWRKVAKTFNFLEYDAPILEPLELYIEKSGEEIVGQLFNFEDRGGRAVALRPEMTPSLARLVGAKANSLKRPIKWFNIGEHYRYERPQKGRLRAFYQFNVDILGESGPGADAELISLLVATLVEFGLNSEDFKIRLSDRDLWILFLKSEGLDDAEVTTVLGVIDKMERMERAKTVEKLAEVVGQAAEALLSKIEKAVKLRDFDELEAFIFALPLEGDLEAQAHARIKDWKALLGHLKDVGVAPMIQIDLGIVRGLAYYTGFVFEAFEATGEGRALAGGGRYDNLIKKLGGPDMPAVGFAMGDVTLLDLLEAKQMLPKLLNGPDFACIIGGVAERSVALADAAALREVGFSVDYPLKEQAFGKQFKEANQKNARFALIYGSEELEQNEVKLRDFANGSEVNIPRDDLIVRIQRFVAEGVS
jgi:histidyl-tRNA synthetase